MKLKTYLDRAGKSIKQGAGELGVNVETFRTWALGKRTPRKQAMAAIYAWSDGQVRPADFYDLDMPIDIPAPVMRRAQKPSIIDRWFGRRHKQTVSRPGPGGDSGRAGKSGGTS